MDPMGEAAGESFGTIKGHSDLSHALYDLIGSDRETAAPERSNGHVQKKIT